MKALPRLPVSVLTLALAALSLPFLSCGRGKTAGIKAEIPDTYAENGLYSYARENGGSYRAALVLYGDLSAALEAGEREEPDFALSIVFPEMLRYSRARNVLEQLATRMAYGISPSFTGCTIGHFQMNVAFAETIERYVSLSASLKARYPGIDFGGASKRIGDRLRRVGRINRTDGETEYLYAFIDICTSKFSLGDLPDEERLVLLATAYNAGMSRSREELELVSALNSYPSGLNSPSSRWNYAAIALEFYQGRKQTEGPAQ
ncbi:MAG: hypothetical protein IJR93_11530 [Treponema sp.]|nr:hypothetical protein [Treponema sp.]MBQ7167565.1 hypothetical protein [Treponema sp.]